MPRPHLKRRTAVIIALAGAAVIGAGVWVWVIRSEYYTDARHYVLPFKVTVPLKKQD